ncbi:hypothetical protein ACIR03_02050 [Clostridium cochlearium]|uniref:hypothetical protein n=1 Tax=Clostridium cochlearium TaxID=1494 RepID=UPI001570F81A|nr:hypothetical protein [Clostridium cochlearium]MBV1820447.1 hypothetical protein [Bacteroidales bacterium MSK.15.36]NSJ91465.1 hypothetical protein [Coprococcus sp. MSK.21.13]MBU5270341.1 hypothetical protein [Clostridium cochlearium]MCG4572161.1 hypothetical protein [Clostridium cochlearium]MCG4579689.1 hypothetical protein [Clostridium cochlearium]
MENTFKSVETSHSLIEKAKECFFVIGCTLLLKRYSLKLIIKIFKGEKENYEK